MRVTFIGGGNMGEAMLAAILDKKLALPQDIAVSDIDENRRQYIKKRYQIGVTADNQLATTRTEVVVLAIKPQNIAEVMAELNGNLRPMQLVLSIVAGTSISQIRQGLNHKCVVRAMPNTPAQIGEGITVWTASAEVTSFQRDWISSILGTMGKEVYVDDEKYIDMATAISGSGPAYFFLFVELLVEAAVNIGLDRDVAQELVIETMLGSGHLIQKSGKEPSELRHLVTSPGGTTAEALLEFERGGLASLVKQAITAAYNKARVLGNSSQ